MKLENKIALVTGSGSGIGRATALLFAESGAKVIVVDKSYEAAENTSGRITSNGHEAIHLGIDITSKSQLAEMIETSMQEWGRIDVLVNNVGGALGNDLLDMEDDQWDSDIALNLTPTARCTKAVLPQNRKDRWPFTHNLDKPLFN